MKISDQQNRNKNTGPSSPGRRTFVKGIAAVGAGVAAFPLLTNTADAQVQAATDKRIPSESSRAGATSSYLVVCDWALLGDYIHGEAEGRP